jgi:hypothetical protein
MGFIVSRIESFVETMQIHTSSMTQITAMFRNICNTSTLVKKKLSAFSGSKNIKYCFIIYQYEGSAAMSFCLVLRISLTLNSGSVICITSVQVLGDTDMEDIPIPELLITCSVLYTSDFSCLVHLQW